MTILYLRKLTTTAKVPVKVTTEAACYDLYADIRHRHITSYSSVNTKKTNVNGDCDKELLLYPGDRAAIPSGFEMTTEPGHKIVIAPRSGNSLKSGITTANALAQIDIDYRNEVFILLINHSDKVIKINHGERIAQIMLDEVIPMTIMLVAQLPEIKSNREGGLGHTGK